MSDTTGPNYSDLQPLLEKEKSNAMIYMEVPHEYDELNFDRPQATKEEKDKVLEKVVIHFPNARVWAGAAVTAGMLMVPSSVIAPTAAALAQGAMAVGLAVLLSARNSTRKIAHQAQQQYITAHASIKQKVRNTELKEKYNAVNTKLNRHLLYGQVLVGGSLVSTVATNTHSTASSLLMTVGMCALTLAFVSHVRLKWNEGKFIDMGQSIAKRRGELQEAPPQQKAPSL